MTPDKQDAPSEWVERAVFLADEYAGAEASAVTATSRSAEDTSAERRALRAHLECKEREHLATKALVKQLAEALELALSSHGVRLLIYPSKDAWDFRCVDAVGRAALAAYQQHVATQEKT